MSTSDPVVEGPVRGDSIAGKNRPQGRASSLRGTTPMSERVVEALLMGCGLLTVCTTAGILFILFKETFAFFAEVPLAAVLFDVQWTPLFLDKHFGIWPLVCGTVLTSGIAMLVALPFGLMSAVYLSEFAGPASRRVLKPALEVLAGVPTIVYGYFALVVVTPALQELVPGLAGFNALSPGIIIGVMVIPTIASLTEDALHAVPDHLREASYALGAAKMPTIMRVVMPAAGSGIAAAVILAIARAIGETMVVAIAAGQQARLTLDPRLPIETMTAYIVQISMGDTPNGTMEYRTIFLIGAALFLMTFAMNVIGFRMARRARRSST